MSRAAWVGFAVFFGLSIVHDCVTGVWLSLALDGGFLAWAAWKAWEGGDE